MSGFSGVAAAIEFELREGAFDDPDACICRGGGWVLSDCDSWHECPIHRGRPHPEMEPEWMPGWPGLDLIRLSAQQALQVELAQRRQWPLEWGLEDARAERGCVVVVHKGVVLVSVREMPELFRVYRSERLFRGQHLAGFAFVGEGHRLQFQQQLIDIPGQIRNGLSLELQRVLFGRLRARGIRMLRHQQGLEADPRFVNDLILEVGRRAGGSLPTTPRDWLEAVSFWVSTLAPSMDTLVRAVVEALRRPQRPGEVQDRAALSELLWDMGCDADGIEHFWLKWDDWASD